MPLPQLNTAEVLRVARSVIDTPEKWATGGICDEKGRHCALGALAVAIFGTPDELDENYSQLEGHPATKALAREMSWGERDYQSDPCEVDVVFQANDDHVRFGEDRAELHAAVLAAFDRAIAEESS